MATIVTDAQKALEEFEKELTCAVCLEYYKEPMVLPCLHYYCKKCITELSKENNSIVCPICRKETSVAVGENDDLPSAHFINRLKDLHGRLAAVVGKEIACELCLVAELMAESFCKQCKKFLCKRCIESHSLMRGLFENHELVGIADVQMLRAEEFYSEHVSSQYCSVHKEVLKLYCCDCKVAVCRDCLLIDHKDHSIMFSETAAKEKKEELLEALKPLRSVEAELDEMVEKIDRMGKVLKSSETALLSDIEGYFEDLHADIEKRKTLLINEVKEKLQAKRVNVSGQKVNLCTAKAQVQSILDYTRHCVNYCTHNEITAIHGDLKLKIQQELKNHGDARKTSCLSVAEEVDVGVELNCAKDVRKLCESNTSVIQVPIKVILLSVTQISYIGSKCNIHILVRLASGASIKGNIVVKSKLKELKKGRIVDNVLEKVGEGTYVIYYTPSSESKYEISVNVQSQSHSAMETVVHSFMAYEPQTSTTNKEYCGHMGYMGYRY